MKRIEEVTKEALKHNIRVRGYISTVIACPYDGKTDPKIVARLTEKLLSFGCYEGIPAFVNFVNPLFVAVSLGDTIGVGSAGSVRKMLKEVMSVLPADQLAVHFHDTYGQALSNVLVAIEVSDSDKLRRAMNLKF